MAKRPGRVSDSAVRQYSVIISLFRQYIESENNKDHINMVQLIDEYIEDIQNYGVEGYTPHVVGIKLKGILENDKIRKEFVNFLKDAREVERKKIEAQNKKAAKKERDARKKEEEKIAKAKAAEILKAEAKRRAEEKRLAAEEAARKKAEEEARKKEEEAARQEAKRQEEEKLLKQTWSKIKTATNRWIKKREKELLKTDINKQAVWEFTKDNMNRIIEDMYPDNPEQITEEMRAELTKRAKDEYYYSFIEYFTNNFSFLAINPSLPGENRGKLSGEVKDRFLKLRESLQAGYDEESSIKIRIKKEIDKTNIRILNARLAVINKNKYIQVNGNAKIDTGGFER